MHTTYLSSLHGTSEFGIHYYYTHWLECYWFLFYWYSYFEECTHKKRLNLSDKFSCIFFVIASFQIEWQWVSLPAKS
mgnify:CR=1 FL=1